MPRVIGKSRFIFIFGANRTIRSVSYWSNGAPRVERIKHNGVLHSESSPALLLRDEHGDIIIEKWCKNGKLHRIGAPALIVRDPGYYITQWFKDGNLHREDGPASIRIKPGGIISEEYWLDGKRAAPYKKRKKTTLVYRGIN